MLRASRNLEIPRIFGGYLEASRHLEVYRILKEEAIYNEALILRWFMRLNLQPYRLRVSGHYYPYHLRTIINAVKPRR